LASAGGFRHNVTVVEFWRGNAEGLRSDWSAALLMGSEETRRAAFHWPWFGLNRWVGLEQEGGLLSSDFESGFGLGAAESADGNIDEGEGAGGEGGDNEGGIMGVK
jgi:hypothetical protein